MNSTANEAINTPANLKALKSLDPVFYWNGWNAFECVVESSKFAHTFEDVKAAAWKLGEECKALGFSVTFQKGKATLTCGGVDRWVRMFVTK